MRCGPLKGPQRKRKGRPGNEASVEGSQLYNFITHAYVPKLVWSCDGFNQIEQEKDAVGNYEFPLTPRALFSPDGSMLPCTDKSNLAHNLEKLNSDEQTETPAADEHVSTSSGNAKIAGMVLVQKMTVSAFEHDCCLQHAGL